MEQVRFTCNLCGETSTKAVSPHAWASGSVFARCDGCRVIHKLVGTWGFGPPRPSMVWC